MAEKVVTLHKDRGEPELEITVGNAHDGDYVADLWERNSTVPVNVGRTRFTEKLTTALPKPLASLDDVYLTCTVRVVSRQAGTATYNVRIAIKQSGAILDDGGFSYSGNFEDAKIVDEVLRFKLV